MKKFLTFLINFSFIQQISLLKVEKIFPNRGPTEGNTRIVFFSSHFESVNIQTEKNSKVNFIK